MSRPSLILPVVAVLGLVLFFFFLGWLLILRYERGDIYPAYSTLRADPMGARAYFEALQGVPGVTAVRGYGHLREELRQKPQTLFLFGFDPDELPSFSEDEVAQLDDYVKKGGRVVITFSPEHAEEDSDKSASEKKEADAQKSKSTGTTTTSDGKKPDATPPDSDKDNIPAGPMTQQEKHERDELQEKKALDDKLGEPNPDPYAYHYSRTVTGLWGFGTDDTEEKAKSGSNTDTDSNADPDDDDTPKADVLAFRSPPLPLERALPWKSALYFVRLEPGWQVLYTAKSNPVLVHRSWGQGEIILASDSYFVSDEALRSHRSPQLLSFLAGPGGLLLFDETHLGTEEQEGIMYLMNKFHLVGGLYALLAVLLLFLWRNSAPLVPPSRVPAGAMLGGAVSGKDSRSGLVNLLRRNLGLAEILPAALAEWQRTVAATQPHLKEKTAAMNSILTTAEMKKPEQVVGLYHQLREINANRKLSDYATKS